VKARGIIFLSSIFLSSQSDETGKCKKGKEAFSPLLTLKKAPLLAVGMNEHRGRGSMPMTTIKSAKQFRRQKPRCLWRGPLLNTHLKTAISCELFVPRLTLPASIATIAAFDETGNYYE
jgi:hypothetical protein